METYLTPLFLSLCVRPLDSLNAHTCFLKLMMLNLLEPYPREIICPQEPTKAAKLKDTIDTNHPQIALPIQVTNWPKGKSHLSPDLSTSTSSHSSKLKCQFTEQSKAKSHCNFIFIYSPLQGEKLKFILHFIVKTVYGSLYFNDYKQKTQKDFNCFKVFERFSLMEAGTTQMEFFKNNVNF